jgi:hypothetical protein
MTRHWRWGVVVLGLTGCPDPNECLHRLDEVRYAVTDNTCGPVATGTLRVFSPENACEVFAEADEGLGLPSQALPRMPGGVSSGKYLSQELWSLMDDRFSERDAGPQPYLTRECGPIRQDAPGPRTLTCRDTLDGDPRSEKPECTAVLTRL